MEGQEGAGEMGEQQSRRTAEQENRRAESYTPHPLHLPANPQSLIPNP